ncbi:MAG TPA: FecR family protein [Candidatus Omnitrophota bacterium]|nr:FecR family protein [Candidatus Omnitrophota bacterium]HQJ14914.1 FecR family protein [Candidatus Omnitrophota bacterium]
MSAGPCFGAGQAEVIGTSGTVEVLLEGADEYTAAEEGIVLEAGDKIKTSAGGAAELSFNEANTNVVRLGENTDVAMILADDEKLEMTTGEVFASVSELAGGSSFEIRTPTAVSGARGTDWVTKVSDEGTDVEAIDSVPYVRHFESAGKKSGQMTLIQPGQMTSVKRFQPPMQPRPMAAGRQQQWQDMKQQVRRRAGEAVGKRQQRPPFKRDDFIREMKDRKARPGDGFKPLVSGGPQRQEQVKEPEFRKAKELKVQEQFKLPAQQKVKELQAQERKALHSIDEGAAKKIPAQHKPVPKNAQKK